MKKCIFTILMMLCLCSMLISQTSPAQPSNYHDLDAGTEANPYLISNLANLRWLSETLSVWGSYGIPTYFKQTADIDADETRQWNNGYGFSPIGMVGHFYGHYDGQGFSISDLYIVNDDSPTVRGIAIGLFGWGGNSEFIGINLINIEYRYSGNSIGSVSIGGIVGWGGEPYSQRSVTILNCSTSGTILYAGRAGGIIGSGPQFIDNCSSSVNFLWSYDVGGIAGGMGSSGEILNSYSVGNIFGTQSAGGILGKGFMGYIENCYSTGDITSDRRAGGIVGDVSGIFIENCYSTGNITAERISGGIIGYGTTLTIANSFSTGIITQNVFPGEAGGIIGSGHGTSILSCYSTGNVSGVMYSGGIVGDGGLFNTIIENCFSTGEITGSYSGGIMGIGRGTIIQNSFSLGNITGIRTGGIVGSTGNMMGEISITNCFSFANISGERAGGIIGETENPTITNCFSTGDIQGSIIAGGIIGSRTYLFSAPIISNCYASGVISGTAGGIVGNVTRGEIENTFWDIETTGAIEVSSEAFIGTLTNVFGLPTIEMKQAATYTEFGWDFDNIWDIDEDINNGYPYLRIFNTYPKLPPVKGLEATIINNHVVLTWQAPAGATSSFIGYHVFRNDDALLDELINDLYFIDSSLENGIYLYKVIAEYSEGVSEPIEIEVEIDFVSVTEVIKPKEMTQLKGNYPNPFNPETTINFDLANDSSVLLEIYNIKGQKINTLVNSDFRAGSHNVVWSGIDDNGSSVSSGIYFYRMTTDEHSAVRRMILMK